MRAQLFAIGLGIALLLPLAVVTGFNIAHNPPKWETFIEKNYDQLRSDAKSKEEKRRLTAEEDRKKKQYGAADQEYERKLFYIAFPIGIAAVLVGALLSVPTVGAGLMFGGIILLTGGCWTYWDRMTAITRFLSILVALAVFMWLGVMKKRTTVTEAQAVKVDPVDQPRAA